MNNDLKLWQDAWDTVSRPIEKQIGGKAYEYLSRGFSDLAKAGRELAGAKPEELSRAGEAIKKMSSRSSFSMGELEKIAEIYRSPEIKKDASGWGKFMRTIPFVGPLIGGLFAFKNIYYGFNEFGTMMGSSVELGVPWYVCLKSNNIDSLAEKHKDDPEKIVLVDSIAKSVRIFWDEVISLIINTADFIKDVIFVFIDLFSAGSSIWLDVGLSFAFMALEMAWESSALKPFKAVVSKIEKGVALNLKTRLKKDKPSDEEEYSFDFS